MKDFNTPLGNIIEQNLIDDWSLNLATLSAFWEEHEVDLSRTCKDMCLMHNMEINLTSFKYVVLEVKKKRRKKLFFFFENNYVGNLWENHLQKVLPVTVSFVPRG